MQSSNQDQSVASSESTGGRPAVAVGFISPKTGKIRHFRVTLGNLVSVLLLVLVFLVSFGYIAGDYTRVQVDRLKNYVQAQRLGLERKELATNNKQLKRKLSALEEQNALVQNLAADVRTQLTQLRDIMSSAAQLGVLPDKSKTDGKGVGLTGLGGAEVDCEKFSKNCQIHSQQQAGKSGSESQEYGYRPSAFLPTGVGVKEFDPDLLAELQYYTAALRVVPLGAPVNGQISSHFGPRYSPFSGTTRHHQGADFTMPHGTKVFSTADGVVVDVTRDRTYGLMVDIRHSNRVVTRYAHLSKVNVIKGNRIVRGTLLGLVGSTGRSTGPHLHYEVRVNNRAINPATLINLPKRFSAVV